MSDIEHGPVSSSPESQDESPISQQDTRSINSESTEGENTLRPHTLFREKLINFIHSTRCQVVIVCLVVLDTLLVITELLLDLEQHGHSSIMSLVLHSFSLSLLVIFLFEVILKIYALRMEYFYRKGEVFDAVVVVVALVLDGITLHSHDAMAGVGLIIVLRLWRVVRIQNSIVMSVQRRGDRKLAKERETRFALECSLTHYKERCEDLEHICDLLRDILVQHNISIPSNGNARNHNTTLRQDVAIGTST